jgi:4-hydroxybutyryl-CoA dehydratase / vinylacetyl-CoA-Delta-isomerase
MALRTADEYRKALIDARRVFYRGQRVANVVTRPELRVAVDHSSLAYDIAEDRPDLAVCDGSSAFYHLPQSAEDLCLRGTLIEEVSRRGAGTIVLKEVASDALFGRLRVSEGAGPEIARAFHWRCLEEDLAVAVGQTDVKGHRALGPAQQADPDHYLRVIDSDADSITVQGTKTHISFSANAVALGGSWLR